MKFLADENMEQAIVSWLRETDHDVLWAAEGSGSSPDTALLNQALAEQRLLLTSDTDFGEMAYRHQMPSYGIILLRIKAGNQKERLQILQSHWHLIVQRAEGHFIVVGNEKIRIRPFSRIR